MPLNRFLLIACERIVKLWQVFEPFFRLSESYLPNKQSKREINQFLDTLICNIESDYQRGTKSVNQEPQIYFDHLYKIRSSMTFHQTKEALLSFLIGGYDTTGTTIPIVLLMLAMHQKVQEDVFEELNNIINSENDGFNEDSLNRMKYLEMVMKESLRLIPIALVFGRAVNQDIELSKKIIENNERIQM